MAHDKTDRKEVTKLAADYGVKVKFTESGGSVYVNEKKHSDPHYAKENIKKSGSGR